MPNNNQNGGSSFSPISALLGVGGIASNLLTNFSNQENNDRNYALALRQQEFAERSFLKQMHFNSPVTQANLLRAAGLNPALMSSGLAGSISSGSSGGMPSNLPMQPMELGGLASVSRGIELNDAEREKTSAESRFNHYKSIITRLEGDLLGRYGDKEHQAKIDKDSQETLKFFQEAALAAAKGDTERAEQQLKHAEEFAEYSRGGRDEEERNYIAQQVRWYAELMRATINEKRASSYRQTQEGNLTGVNYRIMNDPDVIASAQQQYHDTVNNLQQQGKLTKKQTQVLNEALLKAQKDNSSYWYRFALDYATDILKYGADIFLMRGRIGALQSLSNAAEKNADTKARKFDYDSNTYESTRQYDKNGRLKGYSESGRLKRRHR